MSEKEKKEDELSWQEQELMKCISKLVRVGFGVELSKKWFSIKETYKSTARDKWETKEIFSSVGSEIFSEGYLRITLDKFKGEIKRLDL